MTRCDHCRQPLGARTHRYWQMRFCSLACVDAYRDRLSDETRVKIRLLDRAADELTAKLGWPKYGWRWHGDLREHLPKYLPKYFPKHFPGLFAR